MTSRLGWFSFLITPLFGLYLASYALWQDTAGNLVTALHSGWGDLFFHIRAALFFIKQGGWPRESFFLHNEPVGYAFLADFISGGLWQAGLSIAHAFAVPTMILTFTFLGLLQWFTWQITRSRLAAIISTILFVGFGGLSGWYILPQLTSTLEGDSAILRTLPHGVTAWHEADMVVLNPFVMMLHQRAYLLGFPLLMLLLISLNRLWQKPSWPLLLLVTTIGLLLSLAHPFTWTVSLMLIPSWVLWNYFLHSDALPPRRWWLAYLVAFSVIAGLGLLVVKSLQPSASVIGIQWHPGWLAPAGQWGYFWWRNIGLFLLLTPISIIYLLRHYPALATLALASLTPFVAGNLWQFAPWAWDNTKIFAPTWIIFCISVATLLSSWYKRRSFGWAILATVCIVLLIMSGGLEIGRLLSYRSEPLILHSLPQQQFGLALGERLHPRQLILTATVPQEPAFVYAGQPSFIAYEGWLWSQGWLGKYEQRLADSQRIYHGAPDAASLITKNQIAAVVIGSEEIAQGANQTWFALHYPILLQDHGYTVYNTSAPFTPIGQSVPANQ